MHNATVCLPVGKEDYKFDANKLQQWAIWFEFLMRRLIEENQTIQCELAPSKLDIKYKQRKINADVMNYINHHAEIQNLYSQSQSHTNMKDISSRSCTYL